MARMGGRLVAPQSGALGGGNRHGSRPSDEGFGGDQRNTSNPLLRSGLSDICPAGDAE